jgi:glyoxylase-like metal-dependent hydrolase (beta-lactamase superfamily II)
LSIKSVLAAISLTAATFVSPVEASAATPLQIDVYNPGAQGAFPVSSEIVSGASEAVLIDAQFRRNDAQALVQKIKATGKILTTVYISHSDPDYYFGLDTIAAAFPGVKVLATPQTAAAIKASKDGKLAYWGPILKDNAPKQVIVPEPLQGDSLELEGNSLRIVGLDGPTPERTFVWISSRKAVLGGVIVFANLHVWMADTQTVDSRHQWIQTLARIKALKPTLVVPGHYLLNADGTQPNTVKSVDFTRDYLNAFETETARAPNSAALTAAMTSRYPNLPGVPSLDLSAKVIKGEMKWPAQ